jgi:hypothetical protein
MTSSSPYHFIQIRTQGSSFSSHEWAQPTAMRSLLPFLPIALTYGTLVQQEAAAAAGVERLRGVEDRAACATSTAKESASEILALSQSSCLENYILAEAQRGVGKAWQRPAKATTSEAVTERSKNHSAGVGKHHSTHSCNSSHLQTSEEGQRRQAETNKILNSKIILHTLGRQPDRHLPNAAAVSGSRFQPVLIRTCTRARAMIAWPTISGVYGVESLGTPTRARARTPQAKSRATRGAENFSPAMKTHEDIPDEDTLSLID